MPVRIACCVLHEVAAGAVRGVPRSATVCVTCVGCDRPRITGSDGTGAARSRTGAGLTGRRISLRPAGGKPRLRRPTPRPREHAEPLLSLSRRAATAGRAAAYVEVTDETRGLREPWLRRVGSPPLE